MRNLEKVKFIIKDATGLDISYAYDDLVFSEHAALMMQFDEERPEFLACYYNEECEPEVQKEFTERLVESGRNNECRIEMMGHFNLVPKDNAFDVVIKPA